MTTATTALEERIIANARDEADRHAAARYMSIVTSNPCADCDKGSGAILAIVAAALTGFIFGGGLVAFVMVVMR